jgi:uncharacterized Zn-finger protein
MTTKAKTASFVCQQQNCGKLFLHQSELNKHTRVHTGETPFTCNVCSKSFTQSGNLTKHLKSHENEELKWDRTTSSKPFPCTHFDCMKSYTSKTSLQSHLLSHLGDTDREAIEIVPNKINNLESSQLISKMKNDLMSNSHNTKLVSDYNFLRRTVLDLVGIISKWGGSSNPNNTVRCFFFSSLFILVII